MSTLPKKYWTFQQSPIWDGANDKPDPNMPQHTVRADSEQRARWKLPHAELGRRWILIETSANRSTETTRSLPVQPTPSIK